MIVAGEDEHASVLRSPRRVGVLEHVAAAIDARAFPIPHAEDAVVPRAREHADLLGPPEGARREIFVDPGLEFHMVLLEVLARAPQRLIETAERRAAITGDEARGIQAGGPVTLALQHRQAYQRLRAGHENAAALQRVLVVEGGLGEIWQLSWQLRWRLRGRGVHRAVEPSIER